MAGSSKEPKSGTADRAKHLAQENEKLEARLKAVQEKMGRITTKPTFGDKFKAALLPKKHDPLAKLATEREQILKSLRTNQEQRDALDAQPSVKFSDQVEALGPKNNVPSPQLAPTQTPTTAPTQTVGGRSRRDSLSGEEMPDLSKAYDQVELRSSAPEIPKPMEGRSRRDSLSGEELENPNLSKGYEEVELRSSRHSVSEEESPLRQDVSDGYQVDNRTRSFSVSSEEEENPLRQDVSDGYQVDNRTRSFTPPQQVGGPLRGDVSKGYVDVDVNVNVSSGATSVSQNNPLRGDVSDGYDDVEVGSGQTTLAQEDPLRSNVSKGYADVSDLGESNEGEDTLMREIEDPYAEANEQAKFVSVPEVESQVADLSPEESQVIGPKKPEGTTFKMKSLEKQYLEKEKNAPSTTVKIDGKKVTVHEKEWLFDVANEKMREEGRPEITQEQWDKNLAHKQATTQYFNDEQRSEHEVNVKGGKLQQGSGKMKSGSHVFVMDGEGQIYAKQDITTEMDERGRKAHVHHSSFLAGEDVAGAGELEVRRDGTLKGVTDRSGHYKPSEEQTKQALETLEHQGVSMDNVKFTMDRGEHNKIGGMAKEFLQGQVTPEEQQHRQERIDSGKQVSDVSGVMEKTFKERHNVADEVRKKGESVRDSLKKTDNTAKNEARLQQGMGKVVPTPKKGV